MEQSKLISAVIARFKIAYPYYFDKLEEEEMLGLISIYQEELADYSPEVVIVATKNIIRKSKYMPTIKEFLDECEAKKYKDKTAVLNFMLEKGYFKTTSEFEKATRFIEKNIIPHWLMEDMYEYSRLMKQEMLDNKAKMLLKSE